MELRLASRSSPADNASMHSPSTEVPAPTSRRSPHRFRHARPYEWHVGCRRHRELYRQSRNHQPNLRHLHPCSGTVILTSSADATATITSSLNTLRIEDSSESGLVGYWKFDEGTNSGSILDSSSYGNTGTRRGGAGKIWSGSSLPSLQFENRYAMQFDGTDDYVSLGSSSSLNLTSTTFSTWVNVTSF